MNDFAGSLQCRTWTNRPAGTTLSSGSPRMTASPGPGNVRGRSYKAASSRNASVVSAHTAEEVICVVCVAAPDRPAAVAVALAVVADALRAEDLVPSPSR